MRKYTLVSIALMMAIGMQAHANQQEFIDSISNECPDCGTIVTHMIAMDKTIDARAAITTSKQYAFRLAIISMSEETVSTLHKHERVLGRMLTIEEAKEYLTKTALVLPAESKEKKAFR